MMAGQTPSPEGSVVPLTVEDIPTLCKVPRQGECLVCFVYRMWRQHGCGDDLSLVHLYLEVSRLRDAGLVRRLDRTGVGTACALVFTAHHPHAGHWNAGASTGAGPGKDGVPECLRVVAGSTAACDLWLRTDTWRVSGAGSKMTLWA